MDHELLPNTLLFTHMGSRSELRSTSPALDANVNRTIAMHPGWRVMWANDAKCADWVVTLSKVGLVGPRTATWFRTKEVATERNNAFMHRRAHLCRLAQLHLFGGVHVDIGMELIASLEVLRHHRFSAVLATTRTEATLQGLMAARPGDPIVRRSLRMFSQMIEASLDANDRDSHTLVAPSMLSHALREELGDVSLPSRLQDDSGRLRTKHGINILRMEFRAEVARAHKRHVGGPGKQATWCDFVVSMGSTTVHGGTPLAFTHVHPHGRPTDTCHDTHATMCQKMGLGPDLASDVVRLMPPHLRLLSQAQLHTLAKETAAMDSESLARRWHDRGAQSGGTIPRLIHQNAITSPFAETRLSIANRHSAADGWCIISWTDEEFAAAFHRALHPTLFAKYAGMATGAMQSDIARYLVVGILGGYYLDTDISCALTIDHSLAMHSSLGLRTPHAASSSNNVHATPIEFRGVLLTMPKINQFNSTFLTRNTYWPANFAFGSPAGHDFWTLVFDEIAHLPLVGVFDGSPCMRVGFACLPMEHQSVLFLTGTGLLMRAVQRLSLSQRDAIQIVRLDDRVWSQTFSKSRDTTYDAFHIVDIESAWRIADVAHAVCVHHRAASWLKGGAGGGLHKLASARAVHGKILLHKNASRKQHVARLRNAFAWICSAGSASPICTRIKRKTLVPTDVLTSQDLTRPDGRLSSVGNASIGLHRCDLAKNGASWLRKFVSDGTCGAQPDALSAAEEVRVQHYLGWATLWTTLEAAGTWQSSLGDLMPGRVAYADTVCNDPRPLRDAKGALATGCFSSYTCPMGCFVRSAQHKWPTRGVGVEQLLWLEGNVDWALAEPTLVESRPLPKLGFGVVLPLNWHRNFGMLPRIRKMDARGTSTFLPFALRKATAVWRGSTTGLGCIPNSKLRLAMVRRWANDTSGLIDVGFSKVRPCFNAEHLPVWLKKQPIPMSSMRTYKYIISLTGNDVASSLAWLLHTDSVPLMSTPQAETWLMESKLVPWEHYVPIERDGSDLRAQVDELEANPHKAAAIARAGRKFVSAFGNYRRDQALAAEVLVRLAKIQQRAKRKSKHAKGGKHH